MDPRQWSTRTRAAAAGGVLVMVIAVVVALSLSGSSSTTAAASNPEQTYTAVGAANSAPSATPSAGRSSRVISAHAQAEHWIRSFGAQASKARSRILALKQEVASAPSAFRAIASSAQLAQNALQPLSRELANENPSSNPKLAAAEAGFAAAATALFASLGDFIGFGARNAHLGRGGPGQSANAGSHAQGGPSLQPPMLDEQSTRQWNDAARSIWKLARRSNPPTI